MSRTYEIACKTCKIKLWIGQGWPGHKTATPKIYKGKNHLDALEKFLFDHQEHDLIFGDDERLDIDDFEDIEVD